tara:strand:+ start:6943 stop:7782 length:840 start_codon:yes stop_codon:yes gene_type:complete
MEYKKGYKVKPSEIQSNGEVIFTDGTDTFTPNQISCEAYGYRYDSQLGICKAFEYTSRLAIKTKEEKTELKGTNNRIERGVRDTLITGLDNTAKGDNTNVIVGGEKNEIERSNNNGLLIGKMGKITNDSEFCIGGGGFNSEAGLLQYSILQLSGKTTSASDVALTIEGISRKILLPANSITTYEIWLSGLVTGGSSGTAGDYETYEYHGTMRTKNNGTITHNAKISRLLGRTGSLGTKTIDTATAYTLNINIAGQANVNTQWHAVVKLHINKTNAVELT